MFDELKTFLWCSVTRIDRGEPNVAHTDNSSIHTDDYEQYFEIGTIIKVRWVRQQLGVSWKPGWYVARVQSSDLGNDSIEIVYDF